MKKRILSLALAAVVSAAVSVAAQDLTSPLPQYFAIDLAVPVGYDIDASEPVGGSYFALTLPVIDKLTVGLDSLNLAGADESYPGVGLRLGYQFTDALGFQIGYGSEWLRLGASYAIAQERSSLGLAYGLKFGILYAAPTGDFAKSVIAFTVGTSLGL